ncbi:MAG: hypothetical protein IJI14_10050 [Anaerolineaceae bacterium]|nr:hypothetical protein [Anaerolineaceae bacterium]
MKIAYFISSHGFGHASRATAIMEALSDLDPQIHFDIFTGTPEWLFHDAGLTNYTYHPGAVDVGLVQLTPMEADLPASVKTIRDYLDSIPERSDKLASELHQLGTDIVIADISPLGIVTGKKAGLPVYLFENFTWDWIYELYVHKCPEFAEINERLRAIFVQADYRMQSEPLCDPLPSADILIPPASRKPHHSASEFRRSLGIPDAHRIGLISMGGIPENLDFAVSGQIPENLTLLLPGTFEKTEKRGNKILLPHHSGYYHPDMVHAADFVIGKAGYSTIAEVCAAGAAYGFISREDFRESDVTADFLRHRPNTLEIALDRFESFSLDEEITELLALGKTVPQSVNGSTIAAYYILGIW